MADGELLHVNVSPGGVPKLPIPEGEITRFGVVGDRQAEATVHGGPHRAVSILGIEAIHRVAEEGHPIAPGTAGENLTVSGFDVSSLPAGTRLAIGDEVVLELAWPANPCRTIRHSFSDLRFGRLGVSASPADSRMYARVVRTGTVRPGDPIQPCRPDRRRRRACLSGQPPRPSRGSLGAGRVARCDRGRVDIAILDDGDLAMAATPTLPGPIFNLALGFAHLPNLLERATDHFAAHDVTGWVWTDEEPWPDAILDATGVYAAVPVDGPDEDERRRPDGLVVRELGRREVGAWSDVLAAAADLDPAQASAFRALEPHLALAAHHHRFVAELNGTVVGAASLHVHHHVGWLRAGAVLPAFRGQGVQRAMIEARVRHAARIGCDLAGASATAGGSSARNLERVGGRVVATRGRYRIVPSS